MKTKIKNTILFFWILSNIFCCYSCSDDELSSDKDSGKAIIADQTVAKELVKTCRYLLGSIDDKIDVGFVSPKVINGNTGTVTVNGTKKHTTNTFSSGGSTYDNSNYTSLVFSSFSNDVDLTITSGSGTYDYYYDSSWRYAGASSYHINEYYHLTACKTAFQYDSKKYACTVNIDFSTSDATHGRGYSATVKIVDSGKEFSISGFE